MVHRELIPKYDGPFEVVSKVGSLAYRLKLPDRWKIHPTFYVSFLKKFHHDLLDTARQQTRRAPLMIRKEFEKTVLKILDHRTMGQVRKIGGRITWFSGRVNLKLRLHGNEMRPCGSLRTKLISIRQ
ncbi:UNVERIFIED_CONTAM: hypothetical protein Slati_1268800 [Sesamum latifolium]|uniref:Tf2-1-like SH3-like domain-containing protein n=1 Tax=Sesamum latifolium TaxID=2727402 RepID=A0AAW2XFF1_9LAMI